MDQLELLIALVGFVGTNAVFVGSIIGAVLYLRADARANRQEWKAELAVVAASIDGLRGDVAQIDRRLTTLEAKVEALENKLDTKAEELSAQSQRNHRELLIRLAFHHHGDGRHPVAPPTDPEPVDPSDSDR